MPCHAYETASTVAINCLLYARSGAGFVEASKGCCGTGLLEMGPLCTDMVPTCATPSQYMFWDSVHPTQATYRAVAEHFLRTNILRFDN